MIRTPSTRRTAISRFTLAVGAALALSACLTRTGVTISDAALVESIGMTEAELRAEYGVPHVFALDSDDVETLSYGVEVHRLFRLDHAEFVEFTLVDGRVTRTKRIVSRQVADKDRAR